MYKMVKASKANYSQKRVTINVRLFTNSGVYGDGSRNVEPWSSNVDYNSSWYPLLLTSTPMGGHLRFNIFNMHCPPLPGGSSVGARLELMTRRH
ncbi:hypothetical protein TNCV_3037411 [Trichonephila clavipes]|nr:hypothetical protein TNCV_3037411 [Trichonephila clavipes]